jgi:hypothetical protein
MAAPIPWSIVRRERLFRVTNIARILPDPFPARHVFSAPFPKRGAPGDGANERLKTVSVRCGLLREIANHRPVGRFDATAQRVSQHPLGQRFRKFRKTVEEQRL